MAQVDKNFQKFAHVCRPVFDSHRFGPYFVEPIVAGLTEDKKPFISAFDLIGAPVTTDDFVVGGTCTENLYGMCETLYRPDMVRGLSWRSCGCFSDQTTDHSPQLRITESYHLPFGGSATTIWPSSLLLWARHAICVKWVFLAALGGVASAFV